MSTPVVLFVVTSVILAAACAGLGVALWSARRQRADGDAAADLAAARADEHAAALTTRLREELASHEQRVGREVADQHRAGLRDALDALLAVAGEKLGDQARSSAAHLDGRKELIDAELQRMGTTLEQVTTLVQRLESERSAQLGQVTEQLQGVTRVHGELAATTGALHAALTSSQARGQWGERMAEDVLTAAGFKHGVNYVTQRTLDNGARPDVTFLLPGELVLHMDVKFPLANYLAMLEADGDADTEAARKAFLRDVRARVKELPGRGYVDREAGTVDCVLLFLPNEQVYGFVHDQDPTLLDDAMRDGVVLCSPSTLFAVLAVIRQSCDTVALQRTSHEILSLLAGFGQQWEKYVGEVDKLGRQLQAVGNTYDQVAGPRRRQLEKQLDRIEVVREQRDVSAHVVGEVGDRPRLLRVLDVDVDAPASGRAPGEVDDAHDDDGGAAPFPTASNG